MDEAKKRLAGRMRAIYLRLMSTGVGALALTPSSQLSGDSGSTHQGTVVAPVVNRDKRTAAKKLILSLATGERVFMA